MRITVITVCFNAAATIEETIRSVAAQQGADFEYIVVDGGSTDGTTEILARHAASITTLVSEKDDGIFDAMNKGIGLCTGDVVYFLGADDSLVDDRVLADVGRVFEEGADRLIVYGNVVFVGAPPGQVYGPAKPFRTWSIGEFLDNSLCHQALFARRSLFSTVGLFDTRRRLSADYEWVIKVFKQSPKGFFYVDRLIANFFFLGRSSTQSDTTRKEVRTYYFKYLLSFDMLRFYIRNVVLRGWKKKLLGEQW